MQSTEKEKDHKTAAKQAYYRLPHFAGFVNENIKSISEKNGKKHEELSIKKEFDKNIGEMICCRNGFGIAKLNQYNGLIKNLHIHH